MGIGSGQFRVDPPPYNIKNVGDVHCATVNGKVPFTPTGQVLYHHDLDELILNIDDIGVSVQAYDATTLKMDDVGVSVQAYDATTLKSADVGVSVQAYDATTLKRADVGVSVQAYDATTLKIDDIGVSVQAYDATTLKRADVGMSVSRVEMANITSVMPTPVSTTAITYLQKSITLAYACNVCINTTATYLTSNSWHTYVMPSSMTLELNILNGNTQIGITSRQSSTNAGTYQNITNNAMAHLAAGTYTFNVNVNTLSNAGINMVSGSMLITYG